MKIATLRSVLLSLTVGLATFVTPPIAATSAPTVRANTSPIFTFNAATNYSTDARPSFVATGDFNGDGKPDLVVTNLKSNTVSVLLNHGHHMFGFAVNYPAGHAPYAVAVSDFNGDGKLDLAIANSVDDRVSVLFGRGNGAFGAATTHAAGTDPVGITAVDLNGDGRPDLVVADFGREGTPSYAVSVLLNRGNGTFGAAVSYIADGAPRDVAVSDINGDHIPDLVVVSNESNSVRILPGRGDGAFGAATVYAVGVNPVAVAIGDLNGDGRPDLVVVNDADGSLSVLLSQRGGTFGAAKTYATGARPQSVAIGDFNGDGVPDLAVTNSLGHEVSLFPGWGGGRFGATVNVGVGIGPTSVVARDLDGDGRPDLAVANNMSDNVSVLLNGAPASTPLPRPTDMPAPIQPGQTPTPAPAPFAPAITATPIPPLSRKDRVVVFVHGIKGDFTQDKIGYSLYPAIQQIVGSQNVVEFAYFQDAGYAHGGCAVRNHPADLRLYNAGLIPRDVASDKGLQSDVSICDSQSDLGLDATKLDNQLRALAARYRHITIVAHSMGVAITRGWLALAQKQPDDPVLRGVDTLVTFQGAQAGSWVAGAGQWLNSHKASDIPVLGGLLVGAAGMAGFDANRPDIQELAPQSLWYQTINAHPVPRAITYFNLYSDIGVRPVFDAIAFQIPGPAFSMGDLVMLPGDPAPGALPSTGGAQFSPSDTARPYHAHQWRIAGGPYDFDVTTLDWEAIAASAAIVVAQVAQDPTSHFALSGPNMQSVMVTDCDTQAPVSVLEQLARAAGTPTHTCLRPGDGKTGALSAPERLAHARFTPGAPAGTLAETADAADRPRPCATGRTTNCPTARAPRGVRPVPVARTLATLPLVFRDRAGALAFSLVVPRGSAARGGARRAAPFAFVVRGAETYTGRIPLTSKTRTTAAINGTVSARVTSNRGHATRAVRLRAQGTLDLLRHTAVIDVRIGQRRYHLVTDRPTLASAVPVERRIAAALQSRRPGALYPLLPAALRHLYTPTQFARLAAQGRARSPAIVSVTPLDSGAVLTSPVGYTYVKQRIVVRERRGNGALVTLPTHLYMIRENGAWRFFTTDVPLRHTP